MKKKAMQSWGWALVLTAMSSLTAASMAVAAEWQPEVYSQEDTLSLRTVCADEGEYWSPVWLVVLDKQVYVRLGSRAVSRIECNTSKPLLGVEVAGQRFDRMEGVPVPEMAAAVADAMADKYTSDLFIRFFPHPLTLRLVPTGDGAGK